jgi:hydrogenase nickel incorporation protein HypA/HybF
MHELSLAENVVSIVSKDAAQKGLTRVATIEVEVGEVSGVLAHALKEAFPVAARGTMLQGAKLTVVFIPARVICNRCQREYGPTHEGWSCPGGGAQDVSLVSGEELDVKSYTGEAC